MDLFVKADIGAVEGVRKKALFLVVHGQSCTYTLSLGVRGEMLLSRKVDNLYGFEHIAPTHSMYERVVGHVLRRAICRGIDDAETHETDVAVLIDLGSLP